MSQNILKALPELIDAGILSKEKATEIKQYYHQRSGKSGNRLIIVFGVLGAVLVGLGIILIIAHNWDDLSKTTKTILAFLPLALGQLVGIYVILKKPGSIAWREATSVFLFFSVGASISLISQIYNIPGNLSSFLLTWMMLCLPLVYLLKSTITAMLVIIGITYYACETSYWSGPNKTSYEYWLVMMALIPHYYQLLKNKPKSNFFILFNWFFPLSIVISLGTLAEKNEELMFIAYFSLFGLLYMIGNMKVFSSNLIRNNSYLVLGSLGTIVMLLMLSFDWFWTDLLKATLSIISAREFYLSLLITAVPTILMITKIKNQSWRSIQFMDFIFAIFIVIFFIGLKTSLTPIILINIMILVLGLLVIKKGADKDHLGILNYGLSIITALVICRFFDTDISFVIRGLLFMMVGAGFFAANYMMIKKRKMHEN